MVEPLVAILLLNYRNWQDTVACVESIQRIIYNNYSILIVDNGSPNKSVSEMCSRLKDIQIVETGRNLGFTGGVNFAIRHALALKPKYILNLNPDTVVEPQFLSCLVGALEENSEAAIACGTIYHLSDKSSIWYAGGKLIPWRGLAVHFKSLRFSKPYAVSFVTGCMTLLRVDALATIGLQDERFFMYLDDIEYSARVQRHGFQLLYVPHAVIYHRQEQNEESAFKLYYSVRNRLLLIDSAFSSVAQGIARVYFLLVITSKLIAWRIAKPTMYKAALQGLQDYFVKNLGEGRGTSKFA